MQRRTFLQSLAATALAPSFLQSCVDAAGSQWQSMGTPKTDLPSIEFTDETGARRTLADYRDKKVVLNFFFASCPSFCPTNSYPQSRALLKVNQSEDVVVLSITVKPDWDSQETIRALHKKLTSQTVTQDGKEVSAPDPDLARWHVARTDSWDASDTLVQYFAKNFPIMPKNAAPTVKNKQNIGHPTFHFVIDHGKFTGQVNAANPLPGVIEGLQEGLGAAPAKGMRR